TDDGVAGSLRQAVLDANASPGADTIELPAGVYGLTVPGAGEDAGATGDLDITGDLTIHGAGADVTAISSVELDRAFHIHGGNVTLSDLRFGGGGNRTVSQGGGLFVAGGSVTISHCRVSGSAGGSPGVDGQGGGIYIAGGTLMVNQSEI